MYFNTKTDVAQNLIYDFFSNFDCERTFHRKDFKWKKICGYGVISEKNGRFECRTFMQDVWFMKFPSQIFFNDINHGYKAATIIKKNSLWLLPFYMVVAFFFYYEKVCRTMRTAIVSKLLKLALLNRWSSSQRRT